MTLETNATPSQPTVGTGPGAARPAASAGGKPPGGSRPAAPARPAAGAGSRGGTPAAAQRGVRGAFSRRFRMPGTADPKVRLRRLAVVSLWATVLGLGGFGAGIRVLIGLFTTAPKWYLPTICGIGVFGVACTVGAMASVHRRRLPWILLLVATAALIVAWSL